MSLYTGYDAFFYPMRLGDDSDASTTRLRMRDEASTIRDANFTDDLYTSIDFTGEYVGLFPELRSLMGSAGMGSTFFERVDITAEDDTVLKDWGLRIRRTNAFTLDTDDALSKAALKIMGFVPGQGQLASVVEGSDNVLYSPNPFGLCWRSPKNPQSKLSNRINEQSVAGGRGYSNQRTYWGTDQVRLYQYTQIPAAHVREGRASITEYADTGSLPVGIGNNNFYELWQEGISSYLPIYANYNVTDTIPRDWDSLDNPDREILRSPIQSRFADELNSCISRTRGSAEYYDVSFALRVDSSTWGQG